MGDLRHLTSNGAEIWHAHVIVVRSRVFVHAQKDFLPPSAKATRQNGAAKTTSPVLAISHAQGLKARKRLHGRK